MKRLALIVAMLCLSGCFVGEAHIAQAERDCALNGGVLYVTAWGGHTCKNGASFPDSAPTGAPTP